MSWWSLYNSFRIVNGEKQYTAAKNASKALYSSAGLPVGYNLWNANGEYLVNSGLIFDKKGNVVGGELNPTFDMSIPRRKGYENLESWRDEIFRIGQKANATVKFHGGTEKVDYYTSIGYLKDEGYYQSSDYSRITLRSNLNFTPKKWLKGN